MNNKNLFKWFSMLLLMMVAGISGVAAQSLSVADFSIRAGETKDVAITLAAEDAIYGVQTDIVLSEGLSLEGQASAVEGMNFYYNALTSGATRVAMYSEANAAIPAGDVVTLTVKAAESFTGGTIGLSNSYLTTDNTGTEITVADATATVTLTPDVYTVAGTEALTGYNWDVTQNEMSIGTTEGMYVWSAEDITVTNDAVLKFKVVKNNDWNTCWPENDWVITPEYLGGEGIYTITITFNAETKEIDVTGEKTGDITVPVLTPAFADGTYYMVNASSGLLAAANGLDKEGTPLTFAFDETSGYTVTGSSLFAGKQWVAEGDGFYTFYTVENGVKKYASVNTAEGFALTEDGTDDGAVWILLNTEYWENEALSYNVAGTADLCGAAWDVTANKMTKNAESGLFEWKAENITVTNDVKPEFKVAVNNVADADNVETVAWYPSGDNWIITPDVVGGEGVFDITITFNNSTKEIVVTGEKKGDVPEPILTTYTATFDNAGGWEKVYAYAFTGEAPNATEFLGQWPGTELTKNDETGLYDVTIEAAEAPAFIIFNNGLEGDALVQTEDLAFENGKTYTNKVETPEPVEITSMAIVGDFLGLDATGETSDPNWDPANGWAMTQSTDNPAVWTLTTRFVAEAKTYYYKATANGKWGDFELPAEGNNDYNFDTPDLGAGKYILTFTANTEEETLVLNAEKVVPVVFPENAIVYDFEAAAAAGENPANKNGSAANGQAFYGWENADKTDSKRQDYKGYEWAEGSVLPEVCHVWRRSDRINGNVANNGGLKCPSDKEMAVDGLVAGDKVVIVYDAENATNKDIIWAIGDGTSEGGPGVVRATATIAGVEAVTGETTIASGAEILVNSVTPADNGTGYIVFKVRKGMYIKQIAVIPAPEVAEDVYTIAGTTDLTGTAEAWQIDEANNMTLNAETGLYTWSAENIAVSATAQPEFKVVKNNDWNTCWPENNWVITPDVVGGAGIYTITITFNAESTEIGVTGVKTGDIELALGDANADGEVTTSDAVTAVSFALEILEPTPAQFAAADVNKSNDITVSDAVGIVNIALEIEEGQEPEPGTAGARVFSYNDFLTLNGQTLSLTNTTAFAGFQMDVTLAEGALLNGVQLAERAAGMMLSYNRIGENTWRIVALSLEHNTISGNAGELLTLDITGNSTISVTNVEFADAAARAYMLGFNGEATGISSVYGISADSDVYNVNGVRTTTLGKGVNIVRTADGEVKKLFVK